MTEEPETGIRRTPSGMYAIGKVEYEIKGGEVIYEKGGTVGVMLTESQVGNTDEPTLRDLSEGLIAVYGTDYGIHSPTWITRFTDMTRQASCPTLPYGSNAVAHWKTTSKVFSARQSRAK